MPESFDSTSSTDEVVLRKKNATKGSVITQRGCVASSSIRHQLSSATSLTDALQNDWKSRVPPQDLLVARTRNDDVGRRSVAFLQERLHDSSKTWEKRVDDKSVDAKRFTIASKLGEDPDALPFESHRRPNAPEKKVFHVGDADHARHLEVNIQRDGDVKKQVILEFEETARSSEKLDIENGVEEFFKLKSHEKDEVVEMDFGSVPSTTPTQLLKGIKKPTRANMRKPASQNPVKASMEREALLESEMKNPAVLGKVKNSASSVPGTVRLAALAAKIDFAAAAKAIKDRGAHSIPEVHLPKLLLVKGRRRIQVRLVQPVPTSLNDGDSFVVPSPKEVGKFSNKIESTKALDVANEIIRRHEFGVTSEAVIKELSLRREDSWSWASDSAWDRLLKHMKWANVVENPVKLCGHATEDEEFEIAISTTNKIYSVDLSGNALVPLDDAWGIAPSISLLDPEKLLVFDFGPEVYVWIGRHVDRSTRKRARWIAEALVSEGYDYSACDCSPFDPYGVESHQEVGSVRPSWTYFSRVCQDVEPILFRSKFADWGTTFSMGSTATPSKNKAIAFDPVALEMTDGEELMKAPLEPIPFVIEMEDLERGSYLCDGLPKEIVTLSVTKELVCDMAVSQVKESDVGIFYDELSYIMEWKHEARRVPKRLDGKKSQIPVQGRIREAIIYYHGRNSANLDRGTAALHTIENSRERGEIFHVRCGAEPPLFLRILGCPMVTLFGKECARTSPMLFVVIGEDEEEILVREVKLELSSYRSRGVFVMIADLNIFLWAGSDSSNANIDCAKKVVKKWCSQAPSFIGDRRLKMREEREGKESTEFTSVFGGARPICATLGAREVTNRGRVFQLFVNPTGAFDYRVVSNTWVGNPEFLLPVYPALQNQLYGVDQPAMFLIDDGIRGYLWCGCTKDLADERPDKILFWDQSVKCGILTMLSYREEKKKSSGIEIDLAVVTAGVEPREFIEMFPEWNVDEEVKISSLGAGHVEGEMLNPESILLSRKEFYLTEELRTHPLPPGVNPKLIEQYLSPDDFQNLFGMEKEDFNTLPEWKRVALKKEKHFF
ncbi:unnamed protein product [Notodromas monacha]|uniref:HP domain-containing protein n=1 Tax=Notodromas monacha TaxID=399045 RepID=A0A7R9BIE3_9CRUS|nr:unnamed protein product [Notodromas monacha]CAG0916087.1 unnamed protein product [Notodromas monacha]